VRPLPLHHLLDLGLDVDTESLDHESAPVDALLSVVAGGARAIFAVVRRGRAPYAGEIEDLSRARDLATRLATPLLVAPHITRPIARRLHEQGWSYLDETGNVELRGPGVVVIRRVPEHGKRSNRDKAHLPHGNGSLRMARFMIENDLALSPTYLANVAGTSPARASQVLRHFRHAGIAERRPDGWLADRPALLDLFLRSYRGPGGIQRRLHTLLSPLQCARRLAASLQGSQWALSADLGPDFIVAWRAPTHLVAYVPELPHPARLDAVEAEAGEEANLVLVVPEDRSVFSSRDLNVNADGEAFPLADPVQMVWDLDRLGGEDRAEAAERMRTWILEHR
jgi:hypothetical protein